jgi:hypothetical protein
MNGGYVRRDGGDPKRDRSRVAIQGMDALDDLPQRIGANAGVTRLRLGFFELSFERRQTV